MADSIVCHHADKSAGLGSDSAASGVICASKDLHAWEERNMAEDCRVVRAGHPLFFGGGGNGCMERVWIATTAYAALLAASAASVMAWLFW